MSCWTWTALSSLCRTFLTSSYFTHLTVDSATLSYSVISLWDHAEQYNIWLLQMFPCLCYRWYLPVYGLPPASLWLWTWRTWPFSRKFLSLELLLLAAYATSMVYFFISCVRIEAAMLMHLICLKERWDLKFDTNSPYNIHWIHIFILLMF